MMRSILKRLGVATAVAVVATMTALAPVSSADAKDITWPNGLFAQEGPNR